MENILFQLKLAHGKHLLQLKLTHGKHSIPA